MVKTTLRPSPIAIMAALPQVGTIRQDQARNYFHLKSRPALPYLPHAPPRLPGEHVLTNHLHSCLVSGSASGEALP